MKRVLSNRVLALLLSGWVCCLGDTPPDLAGMRLRQGNSPLLWIYYQPIGDPGKFQASKRFPCSIDVYNDTDKVITGCIARLSLTDAVTGAEKYSSTDQVECEILPRSSSHIMAVFPEIPMVHKLALINQTMKRSISIVKSSVVMEVFVPAAPPPPISEIDYKSLTVSSSTRRAIDCRAVAKRVGVEGTLTVKLLVGSDGRVAECGYVSGPKELYPSVKAFYGTRGMIEFEPYRVKGVVSPVYATVSHVFEIGAETLEDKLVDSYWQWYEPVQGSGGKPWPRTVKLHKGGGFMAGRHDPESGWSVKGDVLTIRTKGHRVDTYDLSSGAEIGRSFEGQSVQGDTRDPRAKITHEKVTITRVAPTDKVPGQR